MPPSRSALFSVRPLQAAFILLSLLILALTITPANAATFNVGCSSAGLATAIGLTFNGEADTINLTAPCIYNLSSTLNIPADSGNPLTIQGNGATVRGGDVVRVLNIPGGANVQISNLIITDGRAADHGGGIYNAGTVTLNSVTVSSSSAVRDPFSGELAQGGGIRNSGTLTLNSSIVTGNSATGGEDSLNLGGGIYNSGTLTVNNSTVSNNSTDGSGGGIAGGGTMTVNTSSIFGNSAPFGAGILGLGNTTVNDSTVSGNTGDLGGGIYTIGQVTLNRSTISGNSATSGGGGIANGGSGLFGATTTLNNVTVSGNSATNGGGIWNVFASVRVNNSTITANSAVSGAGIYENATITTSVRNSIVANSTSGGDCFTFGGMVISNSLIEDGSCGVGTGPTYANGNLSGDPNLGAATTGSNGTVHFPLNAGSIAIDKGSNALIPAGMTTDQAGKARVYGGTVDMGSFEFPLTSTVTVQLSLQSRPTPPHAAWITTNDVEIRPVGGGAPIVSGTYASNNQGRITIPGSIPALPYILWVKGSHTLARAQNVSLLDGANTVTTTLLLEGDATDDNQIVLDDFSLLAAAFGTAAGNPNYNAQADFNNDGAINLIDFSLLASNFNQAGAP